MWALSSCLDELPDLRDQDTTVQIAEIVKINEQSILGIEGPASIVDLPDFDPIILVYIHHVLLAVCWQFVV